MASTTINAVAGEGNCYGESKDCWLPGFEEFEIQQNGTNFNSSFKLPKMRI
jgi:hypothetical protein